jgi:two-component system response regulator AtoC
MIDAALGMEPPFGERATGTPAPNASDPEQARVLSMLDACGGNQTMAAERLGISRRSLVYRLQAWGMTKPRRR